MLKFTLCLLIVFAILTVQTQKLRQAVIYLGLFSLLSAFTYMLYNALDVAIAEAVVGSTLATILYLVALQKYKVFSIYYRYETVQNDNLSAIRKREEHLIKRLEIFCAKQELDPHIVYTYESLKDIKARHTYAIIIESSDTMLRIHGHPLNYKMEALITFLRDYAYQDRTIDFVTPNETIEDWDEWDDWQNWVDSKDRGPT